MIVATRTLHSKRKNILGFFGWLAVTFIAAGIGSAASIDAGPFYLQLARPEWAPPAWVFGPVWTALYFLMAVSAWLIWREGGFGAQRKELTVFLAQLGLNALWSCLFFGWHLGAWAFVDIIALWIGILATLLFFWRVKPLAGALLIPYFIWVSFAAALNYAVWRLNPSVL